MDRSEKDIFINETLSNKMAVGGIFSNLYKEIERLNFRLAVIEECLKSGISHMLTNIKQPANEEDIWDKLIKQRKESTEEKK